MDQRDQRRGVTDLADLATFPASSCQMLARKPSMLVIVALANENPHIAWGR